MKKVLIANRGEIAVRIARACEDLGIASVAIYADADADAPHAAIASEAYFLEGTTPAETYLDQRQILDIAKRAQCDAVHPGYGFLSENGDFAEAVESAGLTWIGPSARVIRLLGDKMSAREIARHIGAPLAPGSDEPIASPVELREFADLHGLPVIVKAAYGGGGRGMKVIRDVEEIDEAFESATREARLAFGRAECFVEKFLEEPRHVEVQLIADTHGNVRALGTRDCSLQRRNQKLVEESPAPFLTPDQYASVVESSAELFRKVGYVSAGTVEFLLDRQGTLSFLEVNTRLQVEHPVTEAVTGVDIVAEQLMIASGGRLGTTETPSPQGHAFEFRINAEDPGRGFLPSPGRVERVQWPTGPGIRVDSGVLDGSTIPDQFDSLIAKIVVWGRTREEALQRSRRALRECRILGVATVLPFHQWVLDRPEFADPVAFGVFTTWIEHVLTEEIEASQEFSVGPVSAQRRTFAIDVDGKRMSIRLPLQLTGMMAAAEPQTSVSEDESKPADQASIVAEAPGTLVKWLVEPGSAVEQGEPVAVLEIMKMESQVRAHRAGTLETQLVGPGDSVRAELDSE